MLVYIVFFPVSVVVVTADIDDCWSPVDAVDAEILPALYSLPAVHCPIVPLPMPPTVYTTQCPLADSPDAHH